MSDLYDIYTNYVQSILEKDTLFQFKRHPDYTYMLEHVSEKYGHDYHYLIRTQTAISEPLIHQFCTLNDSVGEPITYPYGQYSWSATSLKYIYHAHLALSHMKSLGKKSASVVELGGGYGGLCLAIHFFAHLYEIQIVSYIIVDLPPILALQKRVLQNFQSHLTPVQFVNAFTYGSDITTTDLYLVSTYCFSEIEMKHQQKYKEVLFPKVSHGFIAWNNIPVYGFGFPLTIEEETPKTGPLNKTVYF